MNTPINARERLPNLLYDMENPTTIAGFQPQTFIGGAQGAMDLGLGIWGMIKDDDINAPVYESTYQTSAVLPGLRDKAVRDAFVGMDDYAARIRARNNKNDAVNSAIARSGGSRAFVQSNVAAADDVLNLANLSIDKEMEARRVQSMSVAGNLENLVIQDKLNKLKDQQYSYESKYRNHMQEIKLDMENTAGAMSRINSGMGNLAQAGSYEEQWGKNGTQRNMMAANILLALSAAGLDKSENSFNSGSEENLKTKENYDAIDWDAILQKKKEEKVEEKNPVWYMQKSKYIAPELSEKDKLKYGRI